MKFDPALGFPREMPDLRKRIKAVAPNPGAYFVAPSTSTAPFMNFSGHGVVPYHGAFMSHINTRQPLPPPAPLPWYCDQVALAGRMLRWIVAVIATGVAIDFALHFLTA